MAEEPLTTTTTPAPPPAAEASPPAAPPAVEEEKRDIPPPVEEKEEVKEVEKVESDPAEVKKEETAATGVERSSSLAAMMEKEASSTSPTAAKAAKAVAEEAEEEKEEKEVEAVASGTEKKKVPESLISFKEESNVVADLSDSERKALSELKQLVTEAINNKQFASQTKQPEEEKQKQNPKSEESDHSTEIETKSTPEEPKPPSSSSTEEEVTIWGIPLLKDDRTDVILLKFLRARDFKVKDSFTMLKNTFQWRKDFNIESLLDEDLGDDLEKVVFMHGFDRDGHPVCYNVYGEFQNKILYQDTFSDEEKRNRFLRWRIQSLERSIRKLDFKPGRISTIFQVNDLKNSPGPTKRELRLATNQALQILQDNYPEFVAKQV